MLLLYFFVVVVFAADVVYDTVAVVAIVVAIALVVVVGVVYFCSDIVYPHGKHLDEKRKPNWPRIFLEVSKTTKRIEEGLQRKRDYDRQCNLGISCTCFIKP